MSSMGSRADPDALFFLQSTHVLLTRQRDFHSRNSEWDSRRLDEKQFQQSLKHAKELDECTFCPQITSHAHNVPRKFAKRCAIDMQRRKHDEIILEFLRRQRANKENAHSFAPDLSLSKRSRSRIASRARMDIDFSCNRNGDFLKRQIMIPHDCI